MWDIYVWLWLNVPHAAFLVTALPLLFLFAVVYSMLEPRYTMKDFRVEDNVPDPPRPAPRRMMAKPAPQVYNPPTLPLPVGDTPGGSKPVPDQAWKRDDEASADYPSHARWDKPGDQASDDKPDNPVWYG